MADEMGNSVLADWRAYFQIKRDNEAQEAAAARAEAAIDRPRGRH